MSKTKLSNLVKKIAVDVLPTDSLAQPDITTQTSAQTYSESISSLNQKSDKLLEMQKQTLGMLNASSSIPTWYEEAIRLNTEKILQQQTMMLYGGGALGALYILSKVVSGLRKQSPSQVIIPSMVVEGDKEVIKSLLK